MFPYFRSAGQIIRSWFTACKHRPLRTQKKRVRLVVETLEGRVTPSTLGSYALVESPAAGSDSDIVVSSGAWIAMSNASWLHTSSSGTGNGLAIFTFDANAGATRSGTFTIAGQTLTVTQAGSTYVAANPLTTLVPSGLTPTGVGLDQSGDVYITDAANNALKEWSASTQTVTTVVSGLSNPSDLALDSAGNVYISSFTTLGTGSIQKWNVSTHTLTTLVSSGLNVPQDVAVDSAGNVYIADSDDNAIKVWNGSTLTTLVSGLNLPGGVDVDNAGNVYISDGGNNAVKEWNATTHAVTTLASVADPGGLAVDGSGNLYIDSQTSNDVYEWKASTGQLSTLVTGSNFTSGGDVCADPLGNVYIGDNGANAVKEWSRAFVPASPIDVGAEAGSHDLLPVLPTSELLTGIFAPTSNQSWLTIGSISNGVIEFSVTANPGANRTADITVLGQQILVTQDAPLTAGPLTPPSATEGQAFSNTTVFHFTDADPNAVAGEYTAVVTLGDGNTVTLTSTATANGQIVAHTGGGFDVQLSYTYPKYLTNATFSITVTDVGGSTTSASTSTFNVTDAGLSATGTNVSATEGAAFSNVPVGTLTDAAGTDSNPGNLSAIITWGEGSPATSAATLVEQGTTGVYTVEGSHTYAEEGSYTISVSYTDVGGSKTTSTSTATVADAPLTAGTVTASGGVEDTTPTTLSATFTDANTGGSTADFTTGGGAVTIHWGDGSNTTGVVSGSAGSYTVTGAHTYAEEGPYSISIAVVDDGGSTTTITGSTTVADAPLTHGTVSASGGVEYTTPTTLSATFTDANLAAPTSDFSGTINWGDGGNTPDITTFTSSAVSGTGGSYTVSGSHQYAEEGPYIITVTINDDGTSSTTDTGSTTVADAPLTAGTVSAGGGVEYTTPTTLSATFTDANLVAPTSDFSGTINWGDGGNTPDITTFTSSAVLGTGGSYTVSASHQYAEEGPYTITVTINDVGTSTTTDTGSTTVADAPLTAGTVSAGGGVEYTTPTTLSATFTDANLVAPTSDFSGTINWSDGGNTPDITTFTSSAVLGTGGSYTVSGSHQYAEEGPYIITVTINDVGTSTTTDTGSTTVADAPLTAGTVSAGGGVEYTTPTTLSATFTDANLAAPTSDFSGTINWGDGHTTNFTSSQVTGGGSYAVRGSHQYLGVSTYSITVAINDNGGSSTSDSGTTTVSKASPTIVTTASSAITLGTTAPTLSDSAVLANGYNETGSLVFTLSGPNNFSYTQTDLLGAGGNGTYTASKTLPTTGTVAGTYQWHASYSGDANNNLASDPGGKAEQTAVSKASPSLTTTAGATVVVGSGGKLSDAAQLSGSYNGAGTIIFYLFAPGVTPNGTDSNNLYSDTVTVSGNGPYNTSTGSKPGGYLPTGTGTYQWVAVYSGDSNNNGATSSFGSEPETVSLPSVLVLNSTASGALSLSGNGSLKAAGYVEVDSRSSTALTASGNSTVAAADIEVVGADQKSGNASFSSPPTTGTAPVADPLAGLAAPSTSGLTNYGSLNLAGNNSMTINPGIYTQLSVSGNAKLTLKPGIYIIAGGGITVSGNAAVTGIGVLVYNAGSNVIGSGDSFGGITITGNATVNLTASSTGAYAGIAIFQSRDNTSALTVNGNANANLNDGLLYTPAAAVADSGSGEIQATMIVNELKISGNGIVLG